MSLCTWQVDKALDELVTAEQEAKKQEQEDVAAACMTCKNGHCRPCKMSASDEAKMKRDAKRQHAKIGEG